MSRFVVEIRCLIINDLILYCTFHNSYMCGGMTIFTRNPRNLGCSKATTRRPCKGTVLHMIGASSMSDLRFQTQHSDICISIILPIRNEAAPTFSYSGTERDLRRRSHGVSGRFTTYLLLVVRYYCWESHVVYNQQSQLRSIWIF